MKKNHADPNYSLPYICSSLNFASFVYKLGIHKIRPQPFGSIKTKNRVSFIKKNKIKSQQMVGCQAIKLFSLPHKNDNNQMLQKRKHINNVCVLKNLYLLKY